MAEEMRPGMLTTYELRHRRQALHQALQADGLDAHDRAALEERLGAVIAEQEERVRSPWGGA
jgi:Spy/CpxP family protein refolding chaperone